MKYGIEIRPWGFYNAPYRKFQLGLFMRGHGEQKEFVAMPAQWAERKPEDYNRECPPLLSLDDSDAQKLIDALWDAGLRPTQGNGSAGQLQATERHLADLQKISDKLLGKLLS